MLNTLKRKIVQARSQWWDLRHNVSTHDEVKLSETSVNGAVNQGTNYVPTSPKLLRRAIETLKLDDLTRYTFIDFGSGKGRALLTAAQFPFNSVVGVEFARELHEQSLSNVDRFRGERRSTITALHMDATEYVLPPTPCVLFFFFPFRKPVMSQVFHNIRASIEQSPRDVIVIHQGEWEWVGPLMVESGFRASEEDPYFRVYRLATPASSQ